MMAFMFFKLLLRLTKTFIKKFIEETFKVEVQKVNIITVKGKTKRGKVNIFRTKSKKKALVRLKSGQKIQLVDGG
jgi:large subunit ribosomal protein L23